MKTTGLSRPQPHQEWVWPSPWSYLHRTTCAPCRVHGGCPAAAGVSCGPRRSARFGELRFRSSMGVHGLSALCCEGSLELLEACADKRRGAQRFAEAQVALDLRREHMHVPFRGAEHPVFIAFGFAQPAGFHRRPKGVLVGRTRDHDECVDDRSDVGAGTASGFSQSTARLPSRNCKIALVEQAALTHTRKQSFVLMPSIFKSGCGNPSARYRRTWVRPWRLSTGQA